MLWKLTCGALLLILIVLILIANNGRRHDLEPDASIRVDVVRIEGRKKIKQHVPKFMLDLYHQNANGSTFAGPDVVRSVIPKSAGSVTETEKTFMEYRHALVFDIPTENEDEEFLSAELKILTVVEEAELNDLEKSIKISIFDNTTDNPPLFLDELHMPRAHTNWLSFNLTTPVQQSQTNHLKVLITMRSYLPNFFKVSLMPENGSIEHDYPILLLSYRSIKNVSRMKRAAVNYEDDYDEDEDERRMVKAVRRARNACRKKSMYVDFAEIDYDAWIVQPSGYEAFQCQGKCFFPVAEHLSPTKHAIVQALVHSISPSKATRSCCVPTKLEPISLLYIDAHGILTYRYAYKDMAVAECGCR